MDHPEHPKTKILFVDDDKLMRKIFLKTVPSDSFLLETAFDGVDALEKLGTFMADIVITDLMMPNMDGLTLLEEIRIRYPDIFVVVVTHSDSIDDAIRAMKAGAYDYIPKSHFIHMISTVIESITGHLRASEEGVANYKEPKQSRFGNIVGQDPTMLEIFGKILDVANTNATVLITGETGTGKDLTASAIHNNSHRSNESLIKVNCAALTETLSNSELFGHEKGAFTGAISQKKGYFEIADKGTIFLDEIGDIPLLTQVSLLHSIESRTFQRVGGTKTIKSNVRIICATNKNLQDLVEQNLFREDLFYRINVVGIELPPLRERKTDIPLLANHFLKKYRKETKKNISGISSAAMTLMACYDWPGNIREMANTIEKAVIFCKGREIVPANLPGLKQATPKKTYTLKLSSWSLPLAEKTLIQMVLNETDGNLNQAAKELNIARTTLYSKIRKYRIRRPD